MDVKVQASYPLKRTLSKLERFSLALESLVNRFVRSLEFNPLYHTGPLAVFFTLVIIVTGVYLTMFYPFGFEASYLAVGNIEANLVGRVVRALHRYASDALLVVALLHGWRTFFMDRFRGPRWLAWLSGVVLAGLVWLAGVTGYWLVMDERAALLNDTLVRLVGGWRVGAAFVVRTLTPSEGNSGWVFILILITVHLGLTALGGLFYYLHIKRLSRPKHFPPRFWMAFTGVILVGAALLVPLGMLPQWQLNLLPGKLDIDLFYLFYLPVALQWTTVGLWAGTLATFILVGLLPWLLRGKPREPVQVNASRCTGCTLCAADCPYQAIRMVERPDGKRHKYLALIDSRLCVSCGVCIGACQPLALSLDGRSPELRLDELVQHALAENSAPLNLVFTCERHAQQAGILKHSNPLGQLLPLVDLGINSQVIILTCLGMAHPSLAENAIKAGAAEVHFIGCPPEDCTNREGNLWLSRRLKRQRLPKLHLAFAQSPIRSIYTPPDHFRHTLDSLCSQTLNQKSLQQQTLPSAYDMRLSLHDWRRFLPAFLLLLVVMAVQVLLSRLPYRPYSDGQTRIEIQLDHQPGLPVADAVDSLVSLSSANEALRVILEVDGQPLLESTYTGLKPLQRLPVIERIWLSPGVYHIRLLLHDSPGGLVQVLYDRQVSLAASQILPLHFADLKLVGDARQGERIFHGDTAASRAGCAVCHSLEPGINTVAPSLAGVAGRVAERVPGLSSQEYLLQSILQPDAYLVEGFPAGRMPSNYAALLSEEEIADLLAYLTTLR